ncbi:hypothetical protein EVAR_74730_1 [Eumeta japonica]|uniref:Uncharacterized protein n=1 Tax=Eumeta variegata TaxID=151549 RepID=A0A4C1SRV4_EUMVA|nr:hypothetical protein EVAR_74730_1 [Eumeta japonica]
MVLALFCLATASGVYQCCEDGALMRPRGYCTGSSKRINRNCTNGHFLLKDIILNGTMLATQDSPNFIFAEDPEEPKDLPFKPYAVSQCDRRLLTTTVIDETKSGTDGLLRSTLGHKRNGLI